MKTEADLNQTIRLVRPLYKVLEGAVADGLRGTWLGIMQRAVLEQLHDKGPMTVPAIGRELVAPRQFIQKTANALIALGLVEKQPNAAHKRSVLLALTERGQETIAGILADEADVLREVAAGIDPDDLRVTQETMRALIKGFQAKGIKAASDDS